MRILARSKRISVSVMMALALALSLAFAVTPAAHAHGKPGAVTPNYVPCSTTIWQQVGSINTNGAISGVSTKGTIYKKEDSVNYSYCNQLQVTNEYTNNSGTCYVFTAGLYWASQTGNQGLYSSSSTGSVCSGSGTERWFGSPPTSGGSYCYYGYTAVSEVDVTDPGPACI